MLGVPRLGLSWHKKLPKELLTNRILVSENYHALVTSSFHLFLISLLLVIATFTTQIF